MLTWSIRFSAFQVLLQSWSQKTVLNQICFILSRNPQRTFCGLRRQKYFYGQEIILFELLIASAVQRSEKLKKKPQSYIKPPNQMVVLISHVHHSVNNNHSFIGFCKHATPLSVRAPEKVLRKEHGLCFTPTHRNSLVWLRHRPEHSPETPRPRWGLKAEEPRAQSHAADIIS